MLRYHSSEGIYRRNGRRGRPFPQLTGASRERPEHHRVEIQEEIRATAAIMSSDPEYFRAAMRSGRLEPDAFRKFVDRHRLAVYLDFWAREPPITGLFAAQLLAHLADARQKQTLRNRDALREMAILKNRFQSANVAVLFLKGPLLAQRYYGDIQHRSSMDIDILVHRDDVASVGHLLEELEFRRRSFALFRHDLTVPFVHAYEYRKAIGKRYLPLDLHWCLQSHFSFRIDYARVWEERRACDLGGVSYETLCDEYALVLILVSTFVDIGLGVCTLKNFLDLHKMLEKLDGQIEWEAFFEKRKEERIFLISLNILDLLLSLFDCGERFPSVSGYLDANARHVAAGSLDAKRGLLKRSRFALGTKRWSFGLYEASAVRSIAWWMLSIPFRIAVHESRDPRFVRVLRNRWFQ